MLKHELAKKPVLKLADPNKTFVLRTDASEVGLGTVLLQDHGGTLFPVAYTQGMQLFSDRKRMSCCGVDCQ